MPRQRQDDLKWPPPITNAGQIVMSALSMSGRSDHQSPARSMYSPDGDPTSRTSVPSASVHAVVGSRPDNLTSPSVADSIRAGPRSLQPSTHGDDPDRTSRQRGRLGGPQTAPADGVLVADREVALEAEDDSRVGVGGELRDDNPRGHRSSSGRRPRRRRPRRNSHPIGGKTEMVLAIGLAAIVLALKVLKLKSQYNKQSAGH